MKCLVIAYMLVCGNIQTVTPEINKYIQDGWQPHGGFGSADYFLGYRGCQVMVKYNCKGEEE